MRPAHAVEAARLLGGFPYRRLHVGFGGGFDVSERLGPSVTWQLNQV